MRRRAASHIEGLTGTKSPDPGLSPLLGVSDAPSRQWTRTRRSGVKKASRTGRTLATKSLVCICSLRMTERGDRTREHLLDVAERLYGERGVASVSMREIRVASGARNTAALQFHFGDRDGLI